MEPSTQPGPANPAAAAKVTRMIRLQLEDNLRALKFRREANEAEALRIRDDTEQLLMAGQAADPPITYDDLTELTGVSRSRIAQIIKEAKERAEVASSGPAAKAKAKAAAKAAGVPASLAGGGGVAVATVGAEALELSGALDEASSAGDYGHVYELLESEAGIQLRCSAHKWASEVMAAMDATAHRTNAELVAALSAPHEAESPE